MGGHLLPGTSIRVRRGRRPDRAHIHGLLGPPAGAELERFYRRILADLGTDPYVAEDATGRVLGVVCLTYARSLMRGGLTATLDGACTRADAPATLLDALVGFAEDRARRRGCRRLTAWVDADDTALRAVLVARGYRAGAQLVKDLEDRS